MKTLRVRNLQEMTYRETFKANLKETPTFPSGIKIVIQLMYRNKSILIA